ncbi:MAG: class I SAM-dependent methyltransferase [Anaerolineae bacterium]
MPDSSRMGEAEEFYATSAEYRDRLRLSGGRTYAQVARAALWRYMPPQAGPRVLDFGCGTGEFARLLSGMGYQVVGSDISHLFLRDALERHGGTDHLAFVQNGPGPFLPFRDGAFDAVAAVNAVEHVADPEPMLRQLARVLRPGGVLVLTFPNLLSPFRPLKRFFSRQRLPRYGPESGETAGESFALLVRDLRLLLTIAARRKPLFAPREADFAHANLYYQLGYGADYDAVWLCNPLDITLALEGAGVRLLECRPFPVASEGPLGAWGRLRTRLPASLSSPILWVGRKG